MRRNVDRERPATTVTRRQLLRLGVGGFGALAFGSVLSACAPGDEELVEGQEGAEQDGQPGRPGEGRLLFASTQLHPVEEAEAVRNTILADFDRPVEFLTEEAGPMIDRLVAETQAGNVSSDVVGGLHGDFSPLVERELLTDLSDLADELADRGFNPDFLELGRYGSDRQYYIPWMQATYIMAARREALDHLPSGADVQALTYDQWLEWGRNLAEATGQQRLGWPAGPDGLIHRFVQGYSYPSWTGALNTAFTGDAALAMWEWFQQTWGQSNRQSLSYGFMQEPLLTGEVWVAWDHVARLVDAFTTDPEQFVAFPAPRGPEGLGYMPVIAGLAVPEGAPDPEGARSLIAYLTQPDTMATTLREVAFYPPTQEVDIPADLDPGIAAQAEAVVAQAAAEDAVPSLLPVGLGEQDGAYNEAFRVTFEQVVVQGTDPGPVLEQQAQELQRLLDGAEASCWQPDPVGEGTCQVA